MSNPKDKMSIFVMSFTDVCRDECLKAMLHDDNHSYTDGVCAIYRGVET